MSHISSRACVNLSQAPSVAELEDEVSSPFCEPIFQVALFDHLANAQEFEIVLAFEGFFHLFGKVFRQSGGDCAICPL